MTQVVVSMYVGTCFYLSACPRKVLVKNKMLGRSWLKKKESRDVKLKKDWKNEKKPVKHTGKKIEGKEKAHKVLICPQLPSPRRYQKGIRHGGS